MKFIICLFLLTISTPLFADTLPQGVTIGQISGPGQEYLIKQLEKREGSGPATSLLNGRVTAHSLVRRERETVPLTTPTGEDSYLTYTPNIFTKRLWLIEEEPTREMLEDYELERFLGELTLDWQLVATGGGRILAEGQVKVDANRTIGGYLATRGLTPRLESEKKTAALEEKLEKHLIDELVRLLSLDLGRSPNPSEIEVGDDSLSRKAKSLAKDGQWEEARKLWEELLRQNPRYGPPLFNMGLYYEYKQNPEAAWKMYREAFLSEATEEHREALTRLTEALDRAGRLPKR